MIIIIYVLITFVAIIAVAYPFLKSNTNDVLVFQNSESDLNELLIKKTEMYSVIKELEFDFQTNKISSEDYQELMNSYQQKALKIIEEIDSNRINENFENSVKEKNDQDGITGNIEDQIEDEINLSGERPNSKFQSAKIVDHDKIDSDIEDLIKEKIEHYLNKTDFKTDVGQKQKNIGISSNLEELIEKKIEHYMKKTNSKKQAEQKPDLNAGNSTEERIELEPVYDEVDNNIEDKIELEIKQFKNKNF